MNVSGTSGNFRAETVPLRRRSRDLAQAIKQGHITAPSAKRARCALQSMSDRNYDRAPEKHKQACEEAAREHERSLPVLRAHEKGC